MGLGVVVAGGVVGAMPLGPTAWIVMPPTGVVTVPGVRVSEAGGGELGVMFTAPGDSVAEPGAIERLGVVAEAPGAVAEPAWGVRYEGGNHEAPPEAAGAVALGAVTVGAVTVGAVTVGGVTVVRETAGVVTVGAVSVGAVTRADAVGTVTVGTVEAPVVGAEGCWRNLSASALPGMVSLSPTRIVILSGGMLFIFWISETEVACLLAIFQRESPGWTV